MYIQYICQVRKSVRIFTPTLARFAACISTKVIYSQTLSKFGREDIAQASAANRACTIPPLEPGNDEPKKPLKTDN
jgi:ribosomal protein L18